MGLTLGSGLVTLDAVLADADAIDFSLTMADAWDAFDQASDAIDQNARLGQISASQLVIQGGGYLLQIGGSNFALPGTITTSTLLNGVTEAQMGQITGSISRMRLYQGASLSGSTVSGGTLLGDLTMSASQWVMTSGNYKLTLDGNFSTAIGDYNVLTGILTSSYNGPQLGISNVLVQQSRNGTFTDVFELTTSATALKFYFYDLDMVLTVSGEDFDTLLSVNDINQILANNWDPQEPLVNGVSLNRIGSGATIVAVDGFNLALGDFFDILDQNPDGLLLQSPGERPSLDASALTNAISVANGTLLYGEDSFPVPGFSTILGGSGDDSLNASGWVEEELVSVADNGAAANGYSLATLVRDHIIVFFSDADNLVLDDNNGSRDIFVRHLDTDTTVRINPAGNGVESNGGITFQGVTGNGQYYLFGSNATNIFYGIDSNNAYNNIYQYDAFNDTILLVNTAQNGGLANGASYGAKMSGDGRFIIFTSYANNLVSFNGSSQSAQLYLLDTLLDTTTLVTSRDASFGIVSLPYISNGSVSLSYISFDGGTIVYDSAASDLVANDSNGRQDVFLWRSGSNTRISVSSNSTAGNGDSYLRNITSNGRFVLFASNASNLVDNDNNGATDLFLRDTQNNTTSLVNLTYTGGQTDSIYYDFPYFSMLSNDGRFVYFASYDTNIADPDEYDQRAAPDGSSPYWYMRDMTLGTTTLVPLSIEVRPSLSPDNGSAVFVTSVDEDFAYYQQLSLARRNHPATLSGGGGNDTLVGSMGSDRLIGGSGSNVLRGEGGRDLYIVSQSGDQITEYAGGGVDTVHSQVTFTLPGQVENLILLAGATNGEGNGLNNLLVGNDGNNLLTGQGGDDTLFGGLGSDTLDGGGGNDLYLVNSSGDAVVESASSGTDTIVSQINKTLDSNVENLTLFGQRATYNLRVLAGKGGYIQSQAGFQDLSGTGNADNNVLTGNNGDNLLSGGDGDDTLRGGLGDDTLQGGNGNDVFLFVSPNDGWDTIQDFSSGSDKLAFDRSHFGQLSNISTLNFSANSTGDGFGSAQQFIFNTTSGVLSYDGDGVGGADAQVLVTLSGVTSLTMNDLTMVGGNSNQSIVLQQAAFSVLEDSEAGTLVGSLSISGTPTQNASVVYSQLRGGSGYNVFAVDSYGQITVNQGAVLDYSGFNHYSLHVQATDGTVTTAAVISIDLEQDNTVPAAFDLGVLNGSTGFRLDGEYDGDWSGAVVSYGGDINGDGLDDPILAAPAPYGDFSYNYIIFGQEDGFADVNSLSDVDGSNGFLMEGPYTEDYYNSVAGAGDINGDGFADVVAGAVFYDGAEAFTTGGFVVFGHAGSFSEVIPYDTMTGSNGFTFYGASGYDVIYADVSSAGDINGDGYDDLLVKSATYDSQDNAIACAYVVFGHGGTFASALDLTSLDGADGFLIEGVADGDLSDVSLSSAGDINGDGYDDMMLSGLYDGTEGVVYVIFGGAADFDPIINLGSLNGDNGLTIVADTDSDLVGCQVASAGDINGDGYDDMIIGASNANSGDGAAYVIFGQASNSSNSIYLSDLNGDNGFVISGGDNTNYFGYAVNGAGDVNGDGYDDLMVGNWRASYNGDQSGSAWVIFGRSGGFDATMGMDVLSSADGFRLDGEYGDDYFGNSVASAGDINGDGFADMIIGAPGCDPQGDYSGSSYVIYGGNFNDLPEGETLTGTSGANVLIGTPGDDVINGNGGADLLRGGAGDDQISISNTTFFRIDGGGGTDTLYLYGSGINLDLTTLADNALQNVEVFNLTGTGNNNLTLSQREVFNLVGAGQSLLVTGDSGDTLNFADQEEWTAGSITVNGTIYDRYTNGAATVLALPSLT